MGSREQNGFLPIERQSLYLKAADSIYNYIRENKLKPGERLPSERAMAETLKISRNSLREGIRLLEAKGFLSVKTGSGIYLNDSYGKTPDLEAGVKGAGLEEMQELQVLLDHQAVKNAISRGTGEEKRRLVEIAKQMATLAERGMYSHTLDYDFHDTLYKMGRNRAIHQLIDRIRNERFSYREDVQHGDNQSVWLVTIPYHAKLAENIQRGREAEALSDMDAILNYGFDLIKN